MPSLILFTLSLLAQHILGKINLGGGAAFAVV